MPPFIATDPQRMTGQRGIIKIKGMLTQLGLLKLIPYPIFHLGDRVASAVKVHRLLVGFVVPADPLLRRDNLVHRATHEDHGAAQQVDSG